MKLHILSDLHLEVSAFEPIDNDADVVVLAGDIGKASNCIEQARMFWPDKEIVFVPGNHEFYRFNRPEALSLMRVNAASAGVHLLDNDEVVIGGVRFLGATLWTDFDLFGEENRRDAMFDGHVFLNDFRLIREGGDRFIPAHSVDLHRESLDWLSSKLDKPFDGKTVVVSHHLPSMLSVAERYKKGNLLSACFASNLDHMLGKMDMWIHGHTHDRFDYMARGTRVICNPRGYVTYNGIENFDFDPQMVAEL